MLVSLARSVRRAGQSPAGVRLKSSAARNSRRDTTYPSKSRLKQRELDQRSEGPDPVDEPEVLDLWNVKDPIVKTKHKGTHETKRFVDLATEATRVMGTHFRSVKKRQKEQAELDLFSAEAENSAPIRLGDFVLAGSDVLLVVRLPQGVNDDMLTMNIRGIVGETAWHTVTARLGPYAEQLPLNVPMAKLVKNDVTADEANAEARAAATVGGADANKASYGEAAGKPVHPWLFSRAARVLRQHNNSLARRSIELMDATQGAVEAVQRSNEVVVLPLLDFAAQVCGHTATRKGRSSVTSLDLAAILTCLGDQRFEFSTHVSAGHVGVDRITVFSRDTAAMFAAAQHGSVPPEYLEHYANGNLGGGFSEARAIEALRAQFPEAGYIDRFAASELLRLEAGALWSVHGYAWLFQQAAVTMPITKHTDASREEFGETVYTIDKEGTRLIDDGFSFSVSGNTVHLGIHISDPGSIDLATFSNGVPLVASARRRGQMFPMLSPEATKEFSLDAPNPPALSLFADIDLTTGKASNVTVKLTTLTNVLNLTTSQADFSEFEPLRKLRELRLRHRFEQGAFVFDTYVPRDYTAPPLSEGDTPSELVKELMILGNDLVAQYCVKHHIPILYRTRELYLPTPQQEKQFKEESVERNGFVGRPWRRFVSGARYSVEPAGYAGSGLRYDTRFTSPLRRLDDLIVHSQIKAHLRGSQLPFSASDLSDLVGPLDVMQQLHRSLNRDIESADKFSTAQARAGSTFEGVVVKSPRKAPRGAIYIPRLGLYADYEGEADLAIDSQHAFKVLHINRYARLMTVELKPTKA